MHVMDLGPKIPKLMNAKSDIFMETVKLMATFISGFRVTLLLYC